MKPYEPLEDEGLFIGSENIDNAVRLENELAFDC